MIFNNPRNAYSEMLGSVRFEAESSRLKVQRNKNDADQQLKWECQVQGGPLQQTAVEHGLEHRPPQDTAEKNRQFNEDIYRSHGQAKNLEVRKHSKL